MQAFDKKNFFFGFYLHFSFFFCTFAADFALPKGEIHTLYILYNMSKNLVIVESPGKTKTIEKFLGPNYHVLSSQGHIRDIEGGNKNNIGIDFDHNYAPNYVVDPNKEKLIATLRSEVAKADKVWLASDEDREGEAIAWHLSEVLQLDPKRTERIVFHEITKTAIQEAILHPRQIDYNLVNAQQARRVLDRIIGFELSPILWRKITTGLSAGRVQSVALRLIVEREEEIESFRPKYAYRVVADFIGCNPGDASIVRAELNHRFANHREAVEFLQRCQRSNFRVSDIVVKPTHRSPAPPFTTSTLQQEAARRLHFTVSKTMRVAQSLYESGHITYMRTDSVNLSSLAITTAKQAIFDQYGETYSHVRQYHTTSKGAQEAHEAIRPAYMSVPSAGSNADERRLYELIYRRTLACQMADAQLEQTKLDIAIDGLPYIFQAQGEVITFDGFLRAYSADEEDSEHSERLPRMAMGEQLRIRQMEATHTATKAPSRYNEATLVRRMEELQIGRPSTYATIIETILQHHYVERGTVPGVKREYEIITLKNGRIHEATKQEMVGTDPQKLLPTDLGRLTTSFLLEQFPEILSYDFTARSEENFDQIAAGEADWVETVDSFYHTFHPLLSKVTPGRVEGRVLGVDPKSGKTVTAKITRLGPCVQIGSAEDSKPTFASLRKGQSIYSISLQEALALFDRQMPFTLCQYEGTDVIIGTGKYGPFVRCGETFVSIPKNQDPYSVTEEDAIRYIEQKRHKGDAIATFGDAQILHGAYGFYIKTPKGNFRIPKGTDPTSLTAADIERLTAPKK